MAKFEAVFLSCKENTQEWRKLVSKLNPKIFHSVSSNGPALGDISFSMIEDVYRRHAPKSIIDGIIYYFLKQIKRDVVHWSLSRAQSMVVLFVAYVAISFFEIFTRNMIAGSPELP